MKTYLVVSGTEPGKRYNPEDNIRTNLIANNSGNILFPYGVMNLLETEESHCLITNYRRNQTEEEIARINETCDAVIVPLADAFRTGFEDGLRAYTRLLGKLKVPCILASVGLRAPFEPDVQEPRPFDDDVKNFVKAFLDHSPIIGLRGAITGDYLKRLGFIPEKDFTVTGCPSLYMHGSAVSLKKTPGEINKYASNMNVYFPQPISAEFLTESFKSFRNSYLIQQRQPEFLDLYYNRRKKEEKVTVFSEEEYEQLKKENRVKFFVDVSLWFDFMKDVDLFAGNRFHGTCAALLTGVPAVIVPFDSRTRELAEYHNIAHVFEKDLKPGETVSDYLGRLDFNSFYASHKKNLMHFKDFLKANGLVNLLEKTEEIPYGTSVAERKLPEGSARPCDCYLSVGTGERLRRKMEFYSIKAKKRKEWKRL